MDEPKVKIYKYQGRLNKLREYEQARKQKLKSNSVNWQLYKRNKGF